MEFEESKKETVRLEDRCHLYPQHFLRCRQQQIMVGSVSIHTANTKYFMPVHSLTNSTTQREKAHTMFCDFAWKAVLEINNENSSAMLASYMRIGGRNQHCLRRRN